MPDDNIHAALNEHRHLAVSAAARAYRKLRQHGIEYEELLQVGLIAIYEAAGRYDPDKGASMQTFLSRRIEGAILDELRKQDWLGRTLRKEVTDGKIELWRNSIEEAKEERASAQGGLTGNSGGDNYYSEWAIEAMTAAEEEQPEEIAQHNQRIAGLIAAVAQLPENDRLMLTLLYDQKLEVQQVAALEGVSPSAITQRIARITDTLAFRMRQMRL